MKRLQKQLAATRWILNFGGTSFRKWKISCNAFSKAACSTGRFFYVTIWGMGRFPKASYQRIAFTV